MDWLLHSLNTNIYQLVLWEERVANCLMSIERGRDPVYLTDHIAHQWGGYRRTEVIESELDSLKTIITACNEVRNFKLKLIC